MSLLYRSLQDEKSRAYYILNDILAVLIVLSVFAIIFESIETWERAYRQYFIWAEMAFVSLFTLEYLLRVITAPKKLNYIFSAFGIVDLLAILPSFLIFFVPIAADIRSLRVLRVLRVLRLLRIFRVLKLIALTKRRHPKTAAVLQELPWYNIEIYLFALFSVITIAGTLIYIAESHVPGTLFVNIPSGLWWAVVTITTVGYGDMVPITVAGKIIAAFTMISGLTLFTLLITVMSKTMQAMIFGSYDEEESKAPDL